MSSNWKRLTPSEVYDSTLHRITVGSADKIVQSVLFEMVYGQENWNMLGYAYFFNTFLETSFLRYVFKSEIDDESIVSFTFIFERAILQLGFPDIVKCHESELEKFEITYPDDDTDDEYNYNSDSDEEMESLDLDYPPKCLKL